MANNLKQLSFANLLSEQEWLLQHDTSNSEQLKKNIQHARGIASYFEQHNTKGCALNIEDLSLFITVFLACVYSGVDIELPSNNTEAILSSLTADLYLGNFQRNNNELLSQAKTNSNCTYQPQDINISLFTSGSTGEPKKITRRLSQLVSEVNTLEQQWGNNIPPHAVFAGSVSQQHIYGLLFRVLWPLLSGRLSWGEQIPFEESLEKLAKQQRFLVFVSSPAFLKRMHENLSIPQGNMMCFSSGGLLTDVQQLICEKQLNNPVIQIYGSSETGGIAHRRINEDWHFFDPVEHQIKNDVLWVKSKHCYQQGWNNTQDQIKINPNSTNQNIRFELLGRADRLVKIEEKRLSLAQIETELNAIEYINSAKTFVWQGSRQSIAVVIKLSPEGQCYLLKNEAKQLKKIIKNKLKGKVDTLALPRYIRFVDELPQDTQGKCTVSMLRAFFE